MVCHGIVLDEAWMTITDPNAGNAGNDHMVIPGSGCLKGDSAIQRISQYTAYKC